MKMKQNNSFEEESISISEADDDHRKRMWKLTRKSLSGYCLQLMSLVEIMFNLVSLVMIIVLKIHKRSKVQNKRLMARTKIEDFQFHLRALGFRWTNLIDLDDVEDFVDGSIWLIFTLGLILHLLKLTMALLLFRGVRQGDIKLIKIWIGFGILAFGLDIQLYPLVHTICTTAVANNDLIGIWPLCQPSSNKWFQIVFKSIFYLSVVLACVHLWSGHKKLDPEEGLEVIEMNASDGVTVTSFYRPNLHFKSKSKAASV